MTQIVLECGNVTLKLSAEERALRLAGAPLISIMELNAWHVNSNDLLGPGDGSAQKPFITVQAALDVVADGDRIFLANANYAEDCVVPVGIDVALIGDGSGDPSNDVRCEIKSLAVGAGSNIHLENLVITDSVVLTGAGNLSTNNVNATFSGTCGAVNMINHSGSFDVACASVTALGGRFTDVGATISTTGTQILSACYSLQAHTTSGGDINLENSYVSGAITTINSGNLTIRNSVASGVNIIDGSTIYDNQTTAFQIEARQELIITDANYTATLDLSGVINIIKITLDATLTNKWTPATITGWIEGRVYLCEVIKESENGIDLSVARAAGTVGWDDDIDPFKDLIDIDLVQKRATVGIVGHSATFGQFGALIITDSNYVE